MYKTIATMKKPRPTQDAIETVVSQFDDTTGFLGLSQKSEAAEKSGPLGGPMSSGAVVKDASSSSSVFPKLVYMQVPSSQERASNNFERTLKKTAGCPPFP